MVGIGSLSPDRDCTLVYKSVVVEGARRRIIAKLDNRSKLMSVKKAFPPLIIYEVEATLENKSLSRSGGRL